MLQKVIQIGLPLILPFVLYGLWLKWARYKAIRDGHDIIPPWNQGPWLLLFAAGVALTGVLLVYTAVFTGSSPDTIYHPPQMVDGVIQPGYFEPKE
ncbi:hypothetical protein [Thalassospira sp.]|uniref:hypothetical protein n=1 Tax=Thalassospira sp. TaxID=1912094 RepID=UPI0027370F08|nr:hypothetical protein [Thalassospira sp.]MDP2696585.1 hypothetical protein [Thalassospira sp.]